MDKNFNVSGYFGIVRDFTQTMLYENKIREYSNELEEQIAVKNKFISILAHDLKSPFHGYIGITNTIIDNWNSINDDELILIVKELNISVQKQYQLLVNLLDWSRLQTGKISFNPVEFNLSELIDDIILSLSVNLTNKSMHIAKEFSENVFMYADRDLMHMLCRNLISNAIKFSNPEGIIKISVNDEKNYTCVNIKDYGMGMNQIEQDKLFKMDTHYSREGTLGEQGTGLGLLLCREIIEKHKGIIWLQSKEGAGSTFSFAIKKKRITLS